jgi:hypothetical protein
MAAYREHLTTSCMLGVGVCVSAVAMGFTPVQGVLAGTITGIGGILPDLDSESGRPIREVFGVTAALAPLVLTRRLMEWGGNTDGAMLLAVLVYVLVRYGGSTLLGILAVHRGMYHSLPAMVIAGELAFLGYKSDQIGMKFLMGTGIMIGFLSHLVLDELYSVEWSGGKLRLNKFSGSAVKILGKSWSANIFAYGLLFLLSYSVWVEGKFQSRLNNRYSKPPIPTEFYRSDSTPPATISHPANLQQLPRHQHRSDKSPAPPEPLKPHHHQNTIIRPAGRMAEQPDDLGAGQFQ